MFELSLLLDQQAPEDFGPMAELETIVRDTLSTQQLAVFSPNASVEISVQLLDAAAMQALNLQYRDQDKPTNVLSFESGLEALSQNDGSELHMLGDLVFCPPVIAAEVADQRKRPHHHWRHLLVHGCLHLCGYDHETPDQARDMEALEIHILSNHGIPNPYWL